MKKVDESSTNLEVKKTEVKEKVWHIGTGNQHKTSTLIDAPQ